MNRIVFGLVLVVFVLGGVYFLRGEKEQLVVPKETEVMVGEGVIEKNVIVLTSGGFEPGEKRIKVGERVVWKNETGRVATVDSNNHPTHRLYSKLNLGRFGDGESLSIVFEESGEYGYHNHLNSAQTGTIIVE